MEEEKWNQKGKGGGNTQEQREKGIFDGQKDDPEAAMAEMEKGKDLMGESGIGFREFVEEIERERKWNRIRREWKVGGVRR